MKRTYKQTIKLIYTITEYQSLKSLFIAKYVDHDDWSTVDWSYKYLYNVLRRFNELRELARQYTTTANEPTDSTISTITPGFNLFSNPIRDPYWEVLNRDSPRDICLSKDFLEFKKLIQNYINKHEQIDGDFLWGESTYAYLERDILAYQDLFWRVKNLDAAIIQKNYDATVKV